MSEVFLDIKEYTGLYQVSNLGNIRSLRREVICSNRSNFTIKEKILKLKSDKDGYKLVNLYNEVGKTHKVHRLVLENFSSQPIGKTLTNHKNGIKSDNRLENLEWCNKSENTIHSYQVLKNKHPQLGKKRK